MTRPRIEPQSTRPVVNTLLSRPNSQRKIIVMEVVKLVVLIKVSFGYLQNIAKFGTNVEV